MGVTIEMHSVSKTFEGSSGAVRALSDISLEVAPSEFVAILGASGCGKSTLLRLVSGLISPSDGKVTVGGWQIEGPYTEIGFVFQSDLLLGWRTSLENVLLQAEMRGIPKVKFEQKARKLLDRVGLAGFDDAYPNELSGGMRQRVAICRALLMDFPLLLMDEPFGALDALTRDQLNLDLGRLINHRPTVLFVTHSVEEAIFLSDRVIVMTPRPGRIDAEISIELPRPRTLRMKDSHAFDRHTSEIRDIFLEQGVLHESGEENDQRRNGSPHV